MDAYIDLLLRLPWVLAHFCHMVLASPYWLSLYYYQNSESSTLMLVCIGFSSGSNIFFKSKFFTYYGARNHMINTVFPER